MSALPPPGMYIDPDDPSRQRFWNGQAWTDHVQPGGERSAPSTGSGGPTTPLYAPPVSTAPPTLPPTPPTTPVYSPYPYDQPPPSFAGPVSAPGRYGRPMHERPLSQAAVWSIILALFCPLVGIAVAIVAITSTGPSGDRRGQGLAITGLVLCVISTAVGAIVGIAAMEQVPSGF